MEENLTQKAIDLAIKGNWGEAIKTNLLILKRSKEDIDCLNRLARAYFETGNIKKAKSTSKKVIKLDSKNNIAANALLKYKNCSEKMVGQNLQGNIDPSIFIEEIGKTKLTTLINMGSQKNVSSLSAGDEVSLLVHSHRVTINNNGTYIGKVPDDLSARIRALVKGGNIYKAFVKTANRDCFRVIIREIKKGKGMETTISFPKENSESVCEDFSDSNS